MTAVCSLEDCGRGGKIRRGLCGTCYKRLRRRGELELLPSSAAERLAAGLERKPNGCLEWTGYTDPDGYGQIGVGGKVVQTHRLAWGLAHPDEPLPPVVRHFVCDNPPCCDPDHLMPGTKAENSADMAAKGRAFNGNATKTRCPQGHPYDGRICRECRRASWRRWKAATKIRTPRGIHG